MYHVSTHEISSMDDLYFINYEIPFTIMASSENLQVHVVAKSQKICPNGIVLESELVSKMYEIPPQCPLPIPSKTSGIYEDEIISISFTSSSNVNFFYSKDGSDFIKLNGSIQIMNDGRKHIVEIYSISSTCYPSPIIELTYEMKQIVAKPTFDPLANVDNGNLFGSQIVVSCLTANSFVECFKNSVNYTSTHSSQNQTIDRPLNITCRCHDYEKNISSEWSSQLYSTLYYIPKPILSISSTTHVGPLEIELKCGKIYSKDHVCDGFIYTTESSIERISKPNILGTTTVLLKTLSDIQDNNGTTPNDNSTIINRDYVSIVLKNQGLNNLKVVAFDSSSGIVSPQVVEQCKLND